MSEPEVVRHEHFARIQEMTWNAVSFAPLQFGDMYWNTGHTRAVVVLYEVARSRYEIHAVAIDLMNPNRGVIKNMTFRPEGTGWHKKEHCE